MNLQTIFLEVKKSFPEIHATLAPFSKKSFMRSEPYSKFIYYNKEQVENLRFSRNAIRGVLAHELAHKVQYKHMNLGEWILFPLLLKNGHYRRRLEREADAITVKRGFGKELLEAQKYTKKKFPKKWYRRFQKAHLTEKEIRLLMKVKQ